MGRLCTSNPPCLVVFLFSIYFSGIRTDAATEANVGVGQNQAESSIHAERTTLANIKSMDNVLPTQKPRYAGSKATIANGRSSIAHESYGGVGSTFSRLSSTQSDSLSRFVLATGFQSKSAPDDFNSQSSSHAYSSKDAQPVRHTPYLASSNYSIIPPLSAPSYTAPSHLSVGFTSLLDATSVTPTEAISILGGSSSGSNEPSKIVSSSHFGFANSSSSITESIKSIYNSENSALPLLNITSSFASTKVPHVASFTSMKLVSEIASSKSVLMTSPLDSSSIGALSVSPVAPSSSWNLYTSVSYSVITNESDIEPIAVTGCNVVLDGLADAMGQMTFCLIKYLRPIEVCAKCTKFHSKLRKYENLIRNTKNCEKELVIDYNGQYQAVSKMYRVQYNMWQDFECEKCYKDRSDTDPAAPWVPKEEFVKSQSLIRDIMVCFANYSQSEIALPYPVMLNTSHSKNGTSPNPGNMICTKCHDMYKRLRKYMKSIHIEGSAEKRWCADMVYGFNETRRVWGGFCITKNQDQESIIALTCFFCFLPVVFYIGTKLHSDVKERKNESRVNYESD